MFNNTKAFSGFSTNDIEEAKHFYGEVLGLDVKTNSMGILELLIAGDRQTIIYPKGDQHVPASFTVLNFPTQNIESTVRELTDKGVEFLRYESAYFEFDELGIARNAGPNIAWFTDPGGNVLSVIEVDEDAS